MENKNQEAKKGQEGKNKYERFGYGMLIIKSSNSNFNADFSGLPRKLPDLNGTIYATDKALKYCIRRYIHDFHPEEKVFTWRRRKEDLAPCDIGENYGKLFSNGESDKKTILQNLLSCIDLRLFGVTYAKGGKDKEAVSFTGPVQISYGVNRLERNIHYSNQILSPYRNPDETKEQKKQTTIGSESKGLESWYVYELIVNPNNLKDVLDTLEEQPTINSDKLFLTVGDIEILKNALCRAVTYVNTCSKIGSESAMLLFVETPNKVNCLSFPMLKDRVIISKNDSKYEIDLSSIFNILEESFNGNNLTYELYYDNNQVTVKGKKGEEHHLRTMKKLNQNGVTNGN